MWSTGLCYMTFNTTSWPGRNTMRLPPDGMPSGASFVDAPTMPKTFFNKKNTLLWECAFAYEVFDTLKHWTQPYATLLCGLYVKNTLFASTCPSEQGLKPLMEQSLATPLIYPNVLHDIHMDALMTCKPHVALSKRRTASLLVDICK